MIREAIFSDDRKYRYSLYREWGDLILGPRKKPLMWLMLNPSLAGNQLDDLTVLKIVGFSRRWGYGALWVGNLMARIYTDPKFLYGHAPEELIGPDNLQHLRMMANEVDAIVCAWGSQPILKYHAYVEATLPAMFAPIPLDRPRPMLLCLGTNRDGSPKHPVRLAYSTELVPFNA